ncbi:ATP phosphoribosyltransferase [Paenibacillus sp. NPDC056579]|uniref:ATP phosphoribosyltransferase n=1 Tax=Paenibacillus sp. NPDC056579 TaxID=3345871 RepID=UPI0036C1BB50
MAIEIIRLAIPKGNTEVSALIRNLGCSIPDDFDESRKYFVPVAGTNLELILAKPIDIPTFVEYGIADIGIVGKEFLLEENRNVYELLDLGLSSGYLSEFGKDDSKSNNPRVATSFPRLALRYYQEKGKQVEIIKLSGRTELALVTGLADQIIEVNTSNSAYLLEKEKICSVSLRLVANPASFQVKNERIHHFYLTLVNWLFPDSTKPGTASRSGAASTQDDLPFDAE